MGFKVLVNSTSKNRVSINKQQRETVRTVNLSTGYNELGKLIDVDASDPDNNETLVYDEVSGKYVIKTLPIVNGGTF